MALYMKIGNTRTQFYFSYNRKFRLLTLPSRLSNSLMKRIWIKILKKYPYPLHTKIVFASVVPEDSIKWIYLFQKHSFMYHELSYTSPHGLVISPSLGSDLIANYLAFLNYPHKDGYVFDFGTATSILVIQDYQLKGVLIGPGIHSSYSYLTQKASLLNQYTLHFPQHLWGTTTQSALESGFYWGFSSLSTGLKQKLDSYFQKKNWAIATGGSLNFIEKELLENFHISYSWIFLGLQSLRKKLKTCHFHI